MEYIIVTSNGYTDSMLFQQEIQQKIDDGFKPIGGLSAIPVDIIDKYNYQVVFYQAMTKG